ncbi:TIGR02680 family protein [Nocardia xishanensis]|uniref:TIGR02680 family protein n=1 Tax=Nocardia xishanensis TaxID=238964 RepID=A0ABW7WXC6_9NOCA
MTAEPVKYFDRRWRLSRAGVVNVWHYLDNEFAISGGRLILRGANGSGKSRALEMLLPFLLDADRRRMDATGSQKVSLDELMKTGARGQTNRIGYLWLELRRDDEYLTLGAHIKYSGSAHRSEVRFFTTQLRVSSELILINANREPLSRDQLSNAIGAHNLTDAEQHRENVRTKVFGLHGESDRDRFTGLMQLLHTLRSPDVGNRIDEGKLPQILSDALPPLSEQTLESAGDRLDGLTETRLAQEKLTETLEHVRRFHTVYRSYAASVLLDSATTLRGVADAFDTARGAREQLTADQEDLRKAQTAAAQKVGKLQDAAAELRTSIESIRMAPLFREADDLDQREIAVTALRHSAEQALLNARRARSDEHVTAGHVDRCLTGVRAKVSDAANALTRAVDSMTDADLPHGRLPESIVLHERPDPPVLDSVMDSLDQTPVAIERPQLTTIEISPEDLNEIIAAAKDCARVATEREGRADRREQEARRLVGERARVDGLERTASENENTAAEERTRAAESATARDEQAIALNRGWRDWIASSDIGHLFTEAINADPVVAALNSDIAVLCGDAPEIDTLLDDLTSLATDLTGAARDDLIARITELRSEVAAEKQRGDELRSEQAGLEGARDPEPPTVPWHRLRHGIPLWQAVDFRPELPDHERAGLEGALLASGLLTATVSAAGQLHAEDGEILVRPSDSRVDSPLSLVLMPDPALPDHAAAVDRVLAAIGWNDPHAVTSVATDGRWRNGALEGRHLPTAARHIGATARTAARRERLYEIATLLEQIDQSIEELNDHQRRARSHRDELDAFVRSAPRSRTLVEARECARTREQQARTAEHKARQARETVSNARAEWSRQEREHRTICDGFALPAGAEELAAVRRACAEARKACVDLDDACQSVISATIALADQRHQLDADRDRRREDETTTEGHRKTWYQAASELAALRATLEVPLQELTDQLRASEDALDRTEADLRAAQHDRNEAASRLVATETKLEAADIQVRDRADELRRIAELFNARLRLPGVRTSATTAPSDPIRDMTDAVAARRTADAVRTALRGAKSFNVNQLFNALAKFGADTTGQLDVQQLVEHDVYLVRIEGAEHHHDLPSVLSYLEDRVDRGRQALTEREREVFTEFILGSVTEELRRRVQQARHLIDAMNASLGGTRTSHGIGVRIGWELDGSDPELRRLMQLVDIADEVRSDQDSEELVTLVRERVERLHTADASAGYTTHLREALDYRAWHSVEVTILGPDPGQTRRISKRAKISQGETRFVSYVTLFAAADGFLSGLPDADRALRLVLLDDAFAKVDERAIGELMGLLVRMDIDFVMTGHALWGTVREVPALDIYEIRRIGDSSVVPTHIHWDGRHSKLMLVGQS